MWACMSLLLKSVRFFLSVFILNETKMNIFNNKRDNVRKTDIINHLDTLTAKKPRHIKQKSEGMDSTGKNKSS